MSTPHPLSSRVAHTEFTGAPSTDILAFWSVTGVVAIAAAVGLFEVLSHLAG